jgi:hypothetical protein
VFALLALVLFCAPSVPAFAQSAEDDDARLRPLEPDFKIINLPTTLPLPVHGGNFELTHRFAGNWNRDFSDVMADFFGTDEGATINIGYRFGLFKHVELAASRTNFDRTIEIQGKYDAFHEEQGHPVGLSAVVSVEGGNNFSRDFEPALGASVSRTLGTAAIVYADPFWVHNSGLFTGTTHNTGFIGVGGRLRLRPGMFVVGEVSPRVAGYDPGDMLYGFGVEWRVGGHVFQLNWSNSTGGATYGQIARGGSPNSLFFGFNLERKFY